MKSRAVMLDRASLDRGDLDLQPLLDLPLKWRLFDKTAPAQLDTHLDDAQIILTNKVVLDRNTLLRHREIRLICVLATGMNNIDLEAAQDLGIQVTNVTGYGTSSVVQHVFMLMLQLVRKQPQYRRAVASGAWSRSEQFCLLDYPISDLASLTLGIIGYGELGHAVAQLAEAFGMSVLISERKGQTPRPGRLRFDEVITTADIISLHCPLTPETTNLIDAQVLQAMRPDAWLINTARGGLVDENALADALDNGSIAGAALDVLSEEPPPADHPLLIQPRDNLIITPHIAWAARSARQKIIELTAENIAAFLQQDR